jgi:hypothetical protein
MGKVVQAYLDNLQQLFRAVDTTNGELVQELHCVGVRDQKAG